MTLNLQFMVLMGKSSLLQEYVVSSVSVAGATVCTNPFDVAKVMKMNRVKFFFTHTHTHTHTLTHSLTLSLSLSPSVYFS